MNGVDEVAYGDKVPFAITGPGEYEHSGVTVQGFLSHSHYGAKEEAVNTIYAVELEDMTLVHLGALSDTELTGGAREGLDEIDVLFVPIGGDGVLKPSEAHELAVSLEPKVIVPIHWSGMGDPKALETFLKAAATTTQTVDKLTLKRKDLSTYDGSILVLSV
jgi:L-ascorbate metabolism protein UlaG (beta-lactamase superfamily)